MFAMKRLLLNAHLLFAIPLIAGHLINIAQAADAAAKISAESATKVDVNDYINLPPRYWGRSNQAIRQRPMT